MGTDGSVIWLTIASISIINLERAMWKQMPCLGLIRDKDDKTLPADLILAIVTAALTGQGNVYIETIPCSSSNH